MKKILIIIICIMANINDSVAKFVNHDVAKKAARNFSIAMNNNCEDTITLYETVRDSNGEVLLYIFNTTKGYIIVSAEDKITPIIGFSEEGQFNLFSMPPQLAYNLEQTKKKIEYIKRTKEFSSNKIISEWTYLLQNEKDLFKFKTNNLLSKDTVLPLIRLYWNQNTFYNKQCPFDVDSNKRTLTGCVATALSQILAYNKWPVTGNGRHSYMHEKYGELDANYNFSAFNWMFTPNQLSSYSTQAEVDAVATLNYLCGVAVEMDYGIHASGAINCNELVPNALINYFQYSTNASTIYKQDYSELEWENIIKNELNNKRVVYYQSRNSNFGHAYICDGYKGDYFHFNFGWGGSNNGYFLLSSITPYQGLEISEDQFAVIGIEPYKQNNYQISFNDQIKVKQTKIFKDSSIDISINLINKSKKTFKGDYCVVLYDLSYNFINYLDIKVNNTLASDSSIIIDFNKIVTRGIPIGKYLIGIFFKPKMESWQEILSKDNISNFIPISIEGNQKYSPVQIRQRASLNSQPVYSSSKISLNIFIKNPTDTTVKEFIYANIYDKEGNFVCKIDSLFNDTLGKKATKDISIKIQTTPNQLLPGKYFVYLLAKRNDNESVMIDPNNNAYNNPVKFDIYENSNIEDKFESESPFQINLNFSSDTSKSFKVFIDSASIHNSSDIDIYRAYLPSGYKYSISGSIEDKYYLPNYFKNSTTPLFKIGFNNSWTDEMIGNQEVLIENIEGGSYFLLNVYPYLKQNLGSYRINFLIKRESLNLVEPDKTHVLTISPNPANSFVEIRANDDTKIECVKIYNINGELVYSLNNNNGISSKIYLNLDLLANGEYLLEAKNSNKNIYKKIIVNK